MKRADENQMTVMVSGMVTSFDAVKGYGYVAQGGGRELFGEERSFQSNNPHVLAVGERVVFQVVQGLGGPHVCAVRKF